MKENIDFMEAREIMLNAIKPTCGESLPFLEAFGQVLSEDVYAGSDVPPFDRSPFDGYALRRDDIQAAAKENPVTLKIIEEIPAGSFPEKTVTAGTAAKILTGGPIPQGADAVVKFELTEFTPEAVTLFGPASSANIIPMGEDVKKGGLLAESGEIIDPALLATLASQGITSVNVHKTPVAGIISTGSELVEANEEISGGMIRNSNRYLLHGACIRAGVTPKNLGIVHDDAESIRDLILEGLDTCDAVFATGGVSVGDYDVTPHAMELAGARILVKKIALKPGGACCYGVKDGKPVFCLSGNPASAITNFYAVALPCLKKLRGLREYVSKTVVTLAEPFGKPSRNTRLVRGRLDLTGGQVLFHLPAQGNVMIQSMIGCDAIAIIPPGSPALPAGTRLEAFLIS